MQSMIQNIILLPTQQSQLCLLFIWKLEDYVTICQARDMISCKLILWGFILFWHTLFPPHCAGIARKLSSRVKNKSIWDKTAKDKQGWIWTKWFGGWPAIHPWISFSRHLTLSNINPILQIQSSLCLHNPHVTCSSLTQSLLMLLPSSPPRPMIVGAFRPGTDRLGAS